MKKTISKETVLAITGASVAKLGEWLKKGLKKHKVDDEYDAHGFYVWYKNNVYRPMLQEQISTTDDGEEIDLDVQAHRSRYEKARASKYQIRAEKLRSKYVTLIEATDALYETAELLGDILEELPTRLAKVTQGKLEDEMLMAIDEEVRQILIDQSKRGEEDGSRNTT